MKAKRAAGWIAGLALVVAAPAAAQFSNTLSTVAPNEPMNRPWTQGDWSALGRLPDWSGIWTPDVGDQGKQADANAVPWAPEAKKQIQHLIDEQKAGRPRGIHNTCLPLGMPGFMLITHNAVEFLFTPGRVTILGELDGNHRRRIYTDGRKHPDDPDLTLHGHSTGHWDGKTLVIDTVGILPDAELALDESVGIENGGDMHIVEHMHLVDDNTLHDDLEITDPKVLTGVWKTTRIFHRHRSQKYDIEEAECLLGNDVDKIDGNGNGVFDPTPPPGLK